MPKKKTIRDTYTIARSGGGRPTLQHRLLPGNANITACGVHVDQWSRAYQTQPIEQVLCRRVACQITQ